VLFLVLPVLALVPFVAQCVYTNSITQSGSAQGADGAEEPLPWGVQHWDLGSSRSERSA
jgi:hypothetical protein